MAPNTTHILNFVLRVPIWVCFKDYYTTNASHISLVESLVCDGGV